MQGAGWMQRVAVPAARDASALRITLTGANGVLGTAEHPLHEVGLATLPSHQSQWI
jgi:hypothetical protein